MRIVKWTLQTFLNGAESYTEFCARITERIATSYEMYSIMMTFGWCFYLALWFGLLALLTYPLRLLWGVVEPPFWRWFVTVWPVELWLQTLIVTVGVIAAFLAFGYAIAQMEKKIADE